MSYDFNEHKHRYAVWTAARAVQRSFAKTIIIHAAIEKIGLRKFAEYPDKISQTKFDALHVQWSNQLMVYFRHNKLPCSYGRAAKIIAIYLKTSVVFPSKGRGSLSKVIHPPMDSILLDALVKEKMNGLKGIRWTQLTQKKYWQMVELIREQTQSFDWRIEKYWYPQRALLKDES